MRILERVYDRLLLIRRGYAKQIKSLKASGRARYSEGVSVAPNVYVEDGVSIGPWSYINRDSTVEKCTIGAYCSISSGVRINPWVHDEHNPSTSPWLDGSSKDLRQVVVIDNDVLVSANVIICSGVHIATGAIIGAGAVVTKDVLPYEKVAGVPAKHIGWRFDENSRQRLLDSEYWTLSPDEAKLRLAHIVLSPPR